MNTLKRRVLFLALLVVCLLGLTILGASAYTASETDVTVDNAVASVTVDATTYYYTSLDTAIADVLTNTDDDNTVTVLKDATMTNAVTLAEGTTLTIVGDGATAPVITYEGTTALFSVANKVALTFNNVTINAANSQNGIVATAGSANSDAANATTVTLTSATLNAGAKTINLTQYPYITVVATDSQILSTSTPSLYAANSGSSVITLNFEDTLIAKSIQITTLTTNFKNVALQDDATALALCNGKSSIVARLNNNKVGGEGAYKDYLTGYFTTLKDALDAAFAGSDTTTVYLLQNTTLPKHYTLTDKHLTLVGTGSTNIVLTYGGGWCFSLRGSAASITTTNLDFANCNGNVFTFGASGGSDGEYAITMTGCNVSWESASGAIYGYHSTSLAITLKDCTFTTTTRDGDAIINSSTANCKNVTMHLDNVTLAGKAIAVYGTSNPVTVTYATVAYANDAEAIADGAVARLGETASGELGKVYFKTLHEAVAAAASGSTITVLADASLTPTTITDKALTIVGSEKHTLTVVASGSFAFQLLGTEASLTLNNLVIDASQTTSASNAFFFGAKNGAASGTYAFTLSSVDVKWKTGSGAIYGYHSVRADITLTDCSFEGGSAIINTVAANATNVTMHLDNVTRVGSVAEVYSGAVVTVTRPAVNYTSDAEAIAGGAFFRLGATEGGLLGEVYFTTLNDAVAKAASGDTIYVIADATFTANFNLNAKAITVAGVSKSVKLSTSIHITLTGDASITFKDITLAITNKVLDSYTATNGNSITFNNVDATVVSVTDKNTYPIRVTSKVAINFTNSTFATNTTTMRTFIYGTTNAVVTSMDVTSCTFTGTRLFEGQGSCKVGTAAAPMTLTDVTSNIALFYIYSCTVYVDVFGGTYTTGFSYGGDNNAHTFVIRFNPTGTKTTTFNEIGYIARTNPLANQTSSVSVSMRNMVVNGNNTNTGMFYSGRDTATFSLIFAENVVFNGANPVTEVANSAKFTITAPDVADDAAAIANKLYFRVGAAANKVYTPDLASALHAAAATGDTVYVLTNVTLSSRSYITGKTVTVEGVNADITLTMPAKKEMMFIGDDAHITFKSINVVADRFVVFSQNTSGKTASLTLENGAHITNHDLAVDNDILIYNGQANAKITVNIKAGASAIVTSKTAVSPKYAVVYSGTGVSTTLNVWGTLKNLAQVPAGANAEVFTAKAPTNNAILNVYEGAVIEGTSDSTYTDSKGNFHGANYSGIVYYSEATNQINVYGGTITINGGSSFAYTGTKCTINVSGGTIKHTGAKYPMFYGGTKTITVTGGTINCNDYQLLNSGTTVYTLENDAAAIAAGAVARISATEGGTYYGSISAAITAAANGDTIYIIRNHASGNFGVSNKKVTITGLSKDITVTNIEGTSSIFLALYDGADVTFTNIHFNVSNRFGRSDAGTHTLVFGENAKVTTNNAIFFYANGATSAGTSTATIKFLKGSVIKSTVAMGSGLIYHNQNNDWDKDGTKENRLMNLNLYIAGTLDFPSGPVYQDHNKNGTHTVYYDAKNANVTTSSKWFVDVFRTKDSNNLLKLYATGFKTTADAAAWAYNNTPATSFVYTADPAAEWAYSFIYADQLSYIQLGDLSAYGPCGRLNSYGGEVWVLRNLSSFNRTASFTDMGTVTIKSYNGATFAFQDAARIQITNTTLILDGIQLTVNSTASGAGHIKLNAGTAEKPSVLKLVNGAKITGPAWNNGQFVYLSGAYTSLYVDETSSIVENASADAMANNNTVIYASTAWANGSITIKGTLTSAANAANVYLLTLNGNGTNALTLDGATLSITGTATGTAALVQVLGGCTLEYENLNNSTLALDQATAATKHTIYVRGAIIFKGLSDDDAAAEAAKYNLGVNFGNVFSSVISTAIINQIPEGSAAEIVLADTTYIYDTVQIFNRDVTFVGKNNANYDLIFEGAANSTAFLIVTNGTLTFKNMNIQTNAQLVAYSGTNNLTFANGVIEINLVNTDVTATLTGAYVVSATLIGSTAHAPKNSSGTYVQANSVTLNVDADSVINFTSPYAGTVYFISFNHNSHMWVYANIDGELNVSATSDTDNETMLFRSNNPGRTQITISETAKVTATLSATRKTNGKAYITSCTGGTSTDNKLTMHLSAISKDGALTLDGMMLFSAYTTSATFTALVIANDNTMSDVLMSWLGKNSDATGSKTPFDEYPLAVSLALNGKVYYSSLGGVIALIPDGATATIQISSNLSSGGTINIVNKTITLEGVGATKPTLTLTGNPAFQLGDNSHLIFKNLDIIAKSNFILTNGTDTKATTKIDIESGVTIDVRSYNGAYFFRAGSVGILTMNIKNGSSVKLLTDGTVRDGAVQGMFDFTTYSSKVAEGSVINVDGQIIYGLKFKGEVADNSRSAMFKVGDTTLDIIFTENADIQLLHENAIGATWNAIVCLDSSSANTIVTFNGCKITLAEECAIYGLNGTNYPGTYLVKDVTIASTGSFLVSDYAAAGGVNSTIIKFSGFALNGNALTQNDKLPYAVLMNITFASEAEAFANAAYFTLIPGTYSNLGGAIEAAEDGATIYVNTNLALTSATIVNKSLTFAGATDGIVITNKSSGYLFTLGSNAHLTIKNLTYEGNYFAQFTAAANTECSLTLGENAHIIGGEFASAVYYNNKGALENDRYILYSASLYGTATITISETASIIRPSTWGTTTADPKDSTKTVESPVPNIFRFVNNGHVVMNVHGALKNLSNIADGSNATIGYSNQGGGMILNIYPGAEIEGTSDSTQYSGYYQGMFYFAVYGTNHHEFNIYGGTIISHGINSLAYFGNNNVTVRIEGSPTILMPDATYNMICLQPNANTQPVNGDFKFYADVEANARIELNGKGFFWHSTPQVSKIVAGKFFTDDNAAGYGAGYRVIDEDGTEWYTVGLGAAAALSRNGGTIYLVGDVTDYGSNSVLDKYLFLEPVKPGLTIKLNGSNLFAVTSGTKDAPVRMYIKDITFTGSCTGVLFAVSGSANAIFVFDNCNMNGTAGVIRLSGTATASVTLNKGNYTLKNYPFNAIDYSNLTVNATDITFVTTGTSNEHSLFFLNNKAIGTFNIKGGSATTAFHTFYTMDTSTAYVNIENFSIITSQWGLGSQSSTVWYVNLKNVDIHAKNTTAARLYAANGSYINIMGGKFSTAKKDPQGNDATLTFGNAITVNIFDAYIASPYMSAISGLTKTVNINIYGGTYIYSGTEAGYAPIMLPKEGNLTVKGGTFINQSGLGPVFSNTVYTNNVLTLEGYNAISNSSNLILNFSDKGTPSANLGAYGRLTLNSLAMTRGARPAFVGENGAMTFKSTVSKSAYEYMQSLAVANEVKFGMLVIRTDLLKNIDDFTHAGLAKYSNAFGDNLELGVDYFDYKASANDYTFHDDGCVTIKLTHSGITDFTAEYSVVFYAEYDVMATIGVDENDNPIYAQTGTTASGKALYSSTVYRYADYEESENARSLADVAYAALQNSANESFTEAEVAKLSTWCGAQNAEKTLDIFLVAGGSNAVGNTPYSKQYAESIINHQCAECGHIADNALFAASTYTCVNKLVHGKPLTIADDKCFCSCGYIYDEETGIPGEIDPETGDILTYIVEPYTAIEDLPEGLTCPATRICGAAKATFRNVLKNSNPNVLYSGIISQKAPQDYGSSIVYATASKYFPVGSAPTLGLGWNADMIGPEYGMATELAKHYTGNKYAAIMKYAMNDAALVTEDAYYSNFARKLVSNADEKEALIDKLADGLYKNFVKMVADQIATYADLGYKVNIAGLYWMQGEADLANSAAYAEALQQLIANIRSDLSTVTGSDLSTLPVVVGEVATFTGTTGNTNRVAMKDAQNTVTGVMIDKTSAYMADTNGIFVNAQDITATGARVIAKILKTKNDQIVIPEVENTTVITDKEGNPIAGLTGHTSLAMSLIAAPSGAVITLKENQTVYTAMNLINSSDIVINGDGKTITVVADAPAIALQNASVTLANVAIQHTGSSAAITLDQSSGLTIEEDTVITAERTAIEMNGNASNLVINGGTFTTTAEDATTADAIIRTSNANVTITDGFFQAADGSSILSIDKNAAHRLIVNIKGGTFVTDDRQVEKIDADGGIIVGEYDTIEAIAFVNNCPTAILVIDPDVLADHPELRVQNAAH